MTFEDFKTNPYYKLDADEEFVIKNYRLIKAKIDRDDKQPLVPPIAEIETVRSQATSGYPGSPTLTSGRPQSPADTEGMTKENTADYSPEPQK